jgi:hypothetical protein
MRYFSWDSSRGIVIATFHSKEQAEPDMGLSAKIASV